MVRKGETMGVTEVKLAPRRYRKSRTSKQNMLQHSSNTANKEAWKVYWKAQGQPWRIEPEIDKERQKYLSERRDIELERASLYPELISEFEQGSFPFENIKLTRADVEWLLATHESRGLCGPVDLSDENQRERVGIDLRGADL